MDLFSFINTKNREIKNDDTEFVLDTAIESIENKKEAKPINPTDSKAFSKTTRREKINAMLSSTQLEYIDKYKISKEIHCI